MDTRQNVMGVFFIVCLLVSTFIAIPLISEAQECRVIRIYGESTQPGKIHIEPEITSISKGTCVVWVNWSKGDEIAVNFSEGKKCQDVTDAPVNFALNPENCYVTSWIALGGTSSLRFNEEGAFDFTINTKDGATTKGKLVVR